MFVMYYQNEALIGADSKKVVLGNGSILRDQTLAVNFEGEKAGCDKIKCYIWSNLGQEENAKGTGSWLEIQ